MKTFHFISVYSILICMLFIASCSTCNRTKEENKIPANLGTSTVLEPLGVCPTNVSKTYKRQFILSFKDPSNINIGNWIKFLGNRYGDKIIDTCLCGIYLFEGDIEIDPQTRRHDASKDQELSGDICYLDWNPEIIGGPHLDLPIITSVIKAKESQIRYKSFPVRIAVIDAGFHQNPLKSDKNNLNANTWINKDAVGGEIRGDLQDNDGNCIPDDYYGVNIPGKSGAISINDWHGTTVAAKILGLPDYQNQKRHNVGLMNIKMTETKSPGIDRATLFDAICSMNYAISKDADIIQASWGYFAKTPSTVFEQLIRKCSEENIILIAAAGNQGVDIDDCTFWPASFSALPGNKHVISVAALKKDYSGRAKFSNYGTTSVQFATKGENVNVLTDKTNQTMDGSSIAASDVTRAAALIILKNGRMNGQRMRTELDKLSLKNGQSLKIEYGALKESYDWGLIK